MARIFACLVFLIFLRIASTVCSRAIKESVELLCLSLSQERMNSDIRNREGGFALYDLIGKDLRFTFDHIHLD